MNSVCILGLYEIENNPSKFKFGLIILEIGGSENTKINLRLKKKYEDAKFPVTSHSVLERYKPNRIRIRINKKNKVFVFVNGLLKYDRNFSFTPNFKYFSFSTQNSSTVEYYFNCERVRSKLFSIPSNVSHLNLVLFLALMISLCVNLSGFFIILLFSCVC